MKNLALIAAALIAAGCSADTTATAERPATTPKAQASSPATDGALGGTQTLNDSEATVRATVYAYRQPLRSAFPPERKGYVYAGAEVRVCATRIADDVEMGLSADPWSLEFADDTVTGPVTSWSDEWFRVPLYPIAGRDVRPGRCVRGWIPFEVPKSKRPVRIVYAPDTGSGQAAPPAVWSVR